MKKFIYLLFVVLMFGALTIDETYAKSSSSFKSSSSSFKSSSSISKPTFSSPSLKDSQSQSVSKFSSSSPSFSSSDTKQTNPTTKSFSSSGSSPNTKIYGGMTSSDVSNLKTQKGITARDSFTSFQSSQKQKELKFQQKTTVKYDHQAYSNGRIQNYRYSTPYEYEQRRTDYYSRYNWQPQPYVYYSSPSFGMWDAMFLWMMLDNINDRHYRDIAYANRNEEGMIEWKKQAQSIADGKTKASEEERTQMKEKLAKLDAMIADAEKEKLNLPVGYIPDDIPTEAVFASDVIQEKLAQDLKDIQEEEKFDNDMKEKYNIAKTYTPSQESSSSLSVFAFWFFFACILGFVIFIYS